MKAVNYILKGKKEQNTNMNAITIDNCINMDFLPQGALDAKIVKIAHPAYLIEEYDAMCEMYGSDSLEAMSVKERINS